MKRERNEKKAMTRRRRQRRLRILAAVTAALLAVVFIGSFALRPYTCAEVYREYAVEAGDTLCAIAKRCTDGDWRYTAEEIARVNGIKNQNEIFAGDVILIPEGEK